MITYRIRRDDTSLEIIEEGNVGRIVINKNLETLTLYLWASGTSYTTYKVFTFAEYLSSGQLITFTLNKAHLGYNLSELASNIGGIIITTV